MAAAELKRSCGKSPNRTTSQVKRVARILLIDRYFKVWVFVLNRFVLYFTRAIACNCEVMMAWSPHRPKTMLSPENILRKRTQFYRRIDLYMYLCALCAFLCISVYFWLMHGETSVATTYDLLIKLVTNNHIKNALMSIIR